VENKYYKNKKIIYNLQFNIIFIYKIFKIMYLIKIHLYLKNFYQIHRVLSISQLDNQIVFNEKARTDTECQIHQPFRLLILIMTYIFLNFLFNNIIK